MKKSYLLGLLALFASMNLSAQIVIDENDIPPFEVPYFPLERTP